MANSAFLKSSISLDSPVFTTKITSPMVVGGTGTTATLTLKGTSSGTTTNSCVLIQPTGGNVGIGTTTPGGTLEVSGALSTGTIPALTLRNTTAAANGNETQINFYSLGTAWGANKWGQLSMVSDGYSSGYLVYRSHDIAEGAANNLYERLRIASNGNVGIGTCTPATKLDVNGIVRAIGYTTTYGTTSTSNNTPTTLFTMPSYGMVIVDVFIANTGAVQLYSAYAIIVNDGNQSRLMTTVGGGSSYMTLSLSGNNVQAAQTSGIVQTVRWSYLNIQS